MAIDSRNQLAGTEAHYDVVVIGGGINGCGIAADAAGRGLSVMLAERSDLASGTSSASSKLIHGGLLGCHGRHEDQGRCFAFLGIRQIGTKRGHGSLRAHRNEHHHSHCTCELRQSFLKHHHLLHSLKP